MKASGALLLALVACAAFVAAAAPQAPKDAEGHSAGPLRRLLGTDTLGLLTGLWSGNTYSNNYYGYDNYGYNNGYYGSYYPYYPNYGRGYGRRGFYGGNRYGGYGRRYGYGYGNRWGK